MSDVWDELSCQMSWCVRWVVWWVMSDVWDELCVCVGWVAWWVMCELWDESCVCVCSWNELCDEWCVSEKKRGAGAVAFVVGGRVATDETRTPHSNVGNKRVEARRRRVNRIQETRRSRIWSAETKFQCGRACKREGEGGMSAVRAKWGDARPRSRRASFPIWFYFAQSKLTYKEHAKNHLGIMLSFPLVG